MPPLSALGPLEIPVLGLAVLMLAALLTFYVREFINLWRKR